MHLALHVMYMKAKYRKFNLTVKQGIYWIGNMWKPFLKSLNRNSLKKNRK